MILCKYHKKNAAAYMSHLDLMRTIGMAIRRTGLSVRFSEGFNPHMLLYFAPPLPVGTASGAEYFVIASEENPSEVMEKLNTSLPQGIHIVAANASLKNPNFAAISKAATYQIALSKAVQIPNISKLLAADTFTISFMQKEEKVTKDVKSRILALSQKDEIITCTLMVGNQNLRADRLAAHLIGLTNNQEIYCTITKTHLFAEKQEEGTLKLVDVDDLFF